MNSLSKRVLVTGARGLIGKETIEPLREVGYDVFALTSKPDFCGTEQVNRVNADIFSKREMQEVIEKIRPSHLLHFAWKTSDDYLVSEINKTYLEASLNLLELFARNGGKRAVFAGTCGEYKVKDTPLTEDDDLEPLTLYAECKNRLREKASAFCLDNDISFAWGRIFYVYGHKEAPSRLTAYILDSLLNARKVLIKAPYLVRDYMYTKDIAGAFSALLDSEVEGAVNICTGQGIAIKDFAREFAIQVGREDLLEMQNNLPSQPSVIVGDNSRLLNDVGYKLKYSLEQAVKNIIKGELNA